MPSMPSNIYQEKPFATYKRLLKMVKPYWRIFLLGIVATIIGSLLDATVAWSIKPLINQGFIHRNERFIQWLPFAVVGIISLRGVVSFGSSYCITRVGRSLVMVMRQKLFRQFLRLPANFYDNHSSGQLLSTLIFNIEQVATAVTSSLLTLIQETALILGLVVVMLSVSWQLTLLFAISAPLIAWVVRYSSQRMRRLSGSVQEAVGDVGHIAEESIEGYKLIRTFGGENYEWKKFEHATVSNRQRELKVTITNTLGSAAVQILGSVPVALTIYLAASPTLNLTAGAFASLIAAMVALFRPMRRLTKINADIQRGIAGAQSVFALLDRDVEKDIGTIAITRSQGKIEFQNVAFSYPKTQKQVLTNINFTVEPAETVALVGRSGSGKSSLVNLLPRFYDVSSGSIMVDGVDICQYRLADLRHQFALVSQNIILFNDTIAHNIAYGQTSDATEAEIIRAAEAAHVMEFVKRLPDGLNTLVGENGIKLSGGQRQRIAIARALLKNAPILILDEATSSLDTESEHYIQTAIDSLLHNQTTLVIAHRLSTIEKADRIIVLDDGHMIESGTHEKLLQKNGHYAKLHAMQFKGLLTSVSQVQPEASL